MARAGAARALEVARCGPSRGESVNVGAAVGMDRIASASVAAESGVRGKRLVAREPSGALLRGKCGAVRAQRACR